MLPHFLARRLLSLSRPQKRLVAIAADVALVIFTVVAAFYLRLGNLPRDPGPMVMVALVATILAIPTFWMCRAYREIFSQAGNRTLATLAYACLAYAVPFVAIYTVVSIPGVPRTVGLIQPLLLFLATSALRLLGRYLLLQMHGDVAAPRKGSRVLVYGAGSSGAHLAVTLNHSREMMLVGFLDDNPALWGSSINGAPIYEPAKLPEIASRLRLDEVLLAMPSAPQLRRNQIIASIRSASLRVRTLPGLMDIAQGSLRLSDIKELDVGDLLGRDPVRPDADLLARRVKGRRILVTGAGGSIGSELCRQLMTENPEVLILLDSSEFALYSINEELTKKVAHSKESVTRVIPLLGSVTDRRRLRTIMESYRPQSLYHAAAYKHVPLVEHNLTEGVLNNVQGTLLTAQLASEYDVEDFVLISTDKAVRPTNAMGASKRASELILQAMSAGQSKTRFSMVRFGNVLDSSGSVVPLFRRQIRDGGPVTITDLRIIRYFMTIPEAAQLVIQAGAMAEGGEVFVLDMGQPIKIAQLARDLIELSGYRVRDAANPSGDIEIVEIGLRPGEKLYEELLIGDNPASTDHHRILKASEQLTPWVDLKPLLDDLFRAALEQNVSAIIALLVKIVPEFKPETSIVDLVHLELEQGRFRESQPPAVSQLQAMTTGTQ